MNLQQFGPDIWIGDGPPVNVFGPFKLPTRMIVVKLSDGSLWINSPIEASTEEMQSVSQMGPIRYLVAPTPLHVWRLASWKACFPSAELCGPKASGAAWAADIDQVLFRGNAFIQELEFFHTRSNTLIFADLIQNYRTWRGVPLDARLSFTRRDLARQSLSRILAWDFDKLIIAHGKCLDRDAKPFVERAFSWLRRKEDR
ncbi:MAG TPA: DUF4336 domain-containing protein [Candidatus Baltobacteraceae bacterium]